MCLLAYRLTYSSVSCCVSVMKRAPLSAVASIEQGMCRVVVCTAQCCMRQGTLAKWWLKRHEQAVVCSYTYFAQCLDAQDV
jgi:hypothetical protein